MNGPEDSTPTPDPQPSGEWDSDEALEFLKMEREVHGEDDEALTKRLLREAAPMAAQSIINISRNSANDNTRLAASRYIVDFIREVDGASETWEDLVGGFVEDAEKLANSPSGPSRD